MGNIKDKNMNFGEYGGMYIPPKLVNILNDLDDEFERAILDKSFLNDLEELLTDYVGRPTPLFLAKNLTRKLGGGKIYLKREDLNHTGAHKINNTLGQVLLAKKLGATRIIAETGAGQHGVATATAASLFGLKCSIYMGVTDAKKQPLNVQRMVLLGAEVIEVIDGHQDLKSAVDSALNDLMDNAGDTFYVLGSAVGPFPYPKIVKYFQSVISREIKCQMESKENKLPDYIVACVGGGSNAIGAFAEFIGNPKVKLIGVEPGGLGIKTGYHAAPITDGKQTIIQGYKTYGMIDDRGELIESYSIASGLNYPGVGPEHAYMNDVGLATYTSVTDFEALHAFKILSRIEGIIPAIESAHALAYAMKLAPSISKEESIVVNLSGRGDKDMDTIFQSEKTSIELMKKIKEK